MTYLVPDHALYALKVNVGGRFLIRKHVRRVEHVQAFVLHGLLSQKHTSQG
jgi:hypothetical protein